MNARVFSYFVAFFATFVLLTQSGCEPDFEPRSKIESLRLLAVRANNPYPKPGETVQLEMLWHDGSSAVDKPRDVQRVWIAGCFNPEGDLFYKCFEQLAKQFNHSNEPSPDTAKLFGTGDTFSLLIPDNLISSRPKSERVQPYGMSYVFVALCAGRLALAEGNNRYDEATGELNTPLACVGQDGNPLGPKDFVFGYYRIYSYENQTNDNPELLGLKVNGKLLSAEEPPVYPICKKGEKCPTYEVQAIVNPESVQMSGATGPDGKPMYEQMWVEYLSTAGKIEASPKLVADARKGFNNDNATQLTAPQVAGKQYFFTVVRDNRGGVSWLKQPILFQ